MQNDAKLIKIQIPAISHKQLRCGLSCVVLLLMVIVLNMRIAYRYKAWALFGIIVFAMVADTLLAYQGKIAQGMAAGAILNFVMQQAFMWLASYRKSGSNGNQMMLDMALALVVKWVIAIIGFAYIFKSTTLFAPAVLMGFILMQGLFFVSLFRLGR